MLDQRVGTEVGIVPSLLDRLVPELGSAGIAVRSRASTGAGGLTGEEASYVQCVERDILWLFNTNPHFNAERPEVLRQFPFAASSVLAFGLRHLFERVVHNLPMLQGRVEAALRQFEPRLKIESTSLEVTHEGHLVMIELKGVLRAESGGRRLSIRTDLQTLASELENSVGEPAGRPGRR